MKSEETNTFYRKIMLPILNLEDLGFLVKVIFFQIHVYGRIYIFKMDYKEIKNDYPFCYTMLDCLDIFFKVLTQ